MSQNQNQSKINHTKALRFLRSTDPVLAEIIKKYELSQPRKKSANHFRTLVESIVSQQLSVKASDTIFKRFF